jgi:predicted secreted protein
VNPVTGVAMYIMIWWIVLFAVLPFGTRPVAEADEATGWRGAPEKPRMARKVLITTLLAGVVWGLFYLVIRSDWLSFRHGWLAMPAE